MSKVYWGYNVKLKKKTKMVNTKEVIMKNGMLAVQGESNVDGTKMFKIIGKATPEDVKRVGRPKKERTTKKKKTATTKKKKTSSDQAERRRERRRLRKQRLERKQKKGRSRNGSKKRKKQR